MYSRMFKESLYRTVLAVLAVEDWEYRVKEETAAGAVQQYPHSLDGAPAG